jgi:Sulfotransferase domain
MTVPPFRKPNLFVVGAPRCGTTAWVSYLSAHPQIGFSEPKEPHFFNGDFPDFRWARTLDEYQAFFSKAQDKAVIGDASVMYLYSKLAAANIADYAPDAKILIFLRKQASFLPSYHHQLLYNHDESLVNFADAWSFSRDGRDRSVASGCRETKFLDYAAVGRFSGQVERYIEKFPPQNIMVVRFENWIKDPRAAYLSILRFLDVPDDGRVTFERVHAAHRHRFGWLSRITQRPPEWLLGALGTLKTSIGISSLRIAPLIRKLNKAEGYGMEVDSAMNAELKGFFAEDNDRLHQLLAKAGIISN